MAPSIGGRRAARERALLILACTLPAAPGCRSTTEVLPGRASEAYDTCAEPSARAALERANAALATGGGEADAVPWLREVVAACPDLVTAHLSYQDAAQRLGGEAAAAMRRYYDTLPDRPSPVVPYVKARLLEDGDVRLRLLEEAVRREPSFYYGHLAIAGLYRRFDRPEEALPRLRAALAARPGFAEASMEAAEVLAALDRPEEAKPHYVNYLRSRPADRAARRAYAHLLVYRLRQPRQAQEILEPLVDEDPQDVVALMDLAAVAWMSGRGDQAARLYRRVLELDPSRARAALNLGNLWFDIGHERGADESAPREAWRRARLAYRFWLNLGQPEGAHDLVDYHLAVPCRMKQIAELLGPEPQAPVHLGDL